MKKKKIFILLGNEDPDTLTGAMAGAYEAGAREAGHDVRRTNIGAMKFDPLLHKGYKEIQTLEPDLTKVQEDMKWADHFVLFYPNWWGTVPAILKGMFDRMILPGFAFRFPKTGILKVFRWERLLKGRTATVFITMNTNPIVAWYLFGDNSNEIKQNILEFSGFKTKLMKYGPVEKWSETKVKKELHSIMTMGKKGK